MGWGSFLNDSHLSQLWSQSTLRFLASRKGQAGGKGDWVGANVRNHVTRALHESLVDFLIMWLKMVEVDGGLNRRAGV